MTRAAFFDMDKTVLRVNSGTLWIKYLRRRGEITRMQTLRALGWMVRYRLTLLDMESLYRRIVARMAGDSEADMIEKSASWYASEVEPTISTGAREAIETHRRAGHRLALLTSSTSYVAEPLAATLDLEGALCTRLAVTDGRFTGHPVEPLCVGTGKVVVASRWAADRGIALADCAFYTDSYTDLPMLQAVGEPVAINPDVRLLRTARSRGWRIHDWASTG